MTLLTVASSSALSWLITISPPRWFLRKSRSHTIESASRWLVGSSRSRVSAPENRMRASSTRRRCPPESVLSCWVEDARLDAEAAGDLGGLGLCGVPATGVQLGVGARPALHPALVDGDVLGGHLLLGLAHAAYDVVEAARRQDPVAREDLGVADARVLREVADLAGRDDLAGGRESLPGEDLGEGGLAGAVATDESDLVPGGDTERHVLHEEAGAGADFELLGVDHEAIRLSGVRRFPLIVGEADAGIG